MSFSKDLLSALSEIVNDVKWHKVGTVDDFKGTTTTKLYPDIEDDDDMVIQPDDVVLFHLGNEEFYAMDCSCPHEGGPLELGDIEDIDGDLAVICPWHSYDFSLKTGESTTGLTTNVYDIKVVDNAVYIKCDHKLTPVKPDTPSPGSNGNSCDSPNGIHNGTTCEESLSMLATRVLNTSEPMEKVKLTQETYVKWKEGKISDIGFSEMPDQPKRKEDLVTKEPGQIKRGKGGTLKSRIALLHSLANIEQWAIDLAWDIMGRFSQYKVDGKNLPKEFFDDFLKVANDEAKHFLMISTRLEELDSYFGALAVHNGLWQSAEETSHDLLARLAIVHMVHEARGLDVQPKTTERFVSQSDKESALLMDVVYNDEITHVACGMKWFTYICNNLKPPLDPVATFHKLVKKHFKGYLKPPFNTTGRTIAGMNEEWYTPLVKPQTAVS